LRRVFRATAGPGGMQTDRTVARTSAGLHCLCEVVASHRLG